MASIDQSSNNNKKMKGVALEPPPRRYGPYERIMLDLKLSSEINLAESFRHTNGHPGGHVGSSDEAVDEKGKRIMPTSPPRAFKCLYCKREFATSQALGGHHKYERAVAKRKSGVGMNGPLYKYPLGPCSSMHTMPFYGYPYGRSPFGVRGDSMIHKPSYYPNWGGGSGSGSGLGFPLRYGLWPDRVVPPVMPSLDDYYNLVRLRVKTDSIRSLMRSYTYPENGSTTHHFTISKVENVFNFNPSGVGNAIGNVADVDVGGAGLRLGWDPEGGRGAEMEDPGVNLALTL